MTLLSFRIRRNIPVTYIHRFSYSASRWICSCKFSGISLFPPDCFEFIGNIDMWHRRQPLSCSRLSQETEDHRKCFGKSDFAQSEWKHWLVLVSSEARTAAIPLAALTSKLLFQLNYWFFNDPKLQIGTQISIRSALLKLPSSDQRCEECFLAFDDRIYRRDMDGGSSVFFKAYPESGSFLSRQAQQAGGGKFFIIIRLFFPESEGSLSVLAHLFFRLLVIEGFSDSIQ